MLLLPLVRRDFLPFALSLLLITLQALPLAAAEISVSPTQVSLNGLNLRQQLLVDLEGKDVTREASFESLGPDVVSVDGNGHLTARSEGTANVRVQAGGQQFEVKVQVDSLRTDRVVDFVTEVQPLLTRYSCNSGGCHGKASGQNGFKLSLFGFDNDYDHDAIASASRGRRIMPAVPDRSLLLTKAVGTVPHGGGRRFEVHSEPYNLLLEWIRTGAPASSPDVPIVERIVIEPAERILDANQRQQLRVTAWYTDKSHRDVTQYTDYSSNLDVVASVDSTGLVSTAQQSGEATVMARYMGQVAVFRAIRPHGTPLDSLPEFTPRGEIDRLAAEKWKKLGLRPSPICDDATFLRRATIDLNGRLPTVEETRQFLDSSVADKRDQLIDRLLASPDYANYFALKWSVILRNSRLAGADQAAYAFHQWIKDKIARNRPYDEFTRGIVAASGEWQDAPAINWYWQSRDDQLHTVTADTAQIFLGIRLQCARCHHHPYEHWGQEDYYGLAGFYARLGRKSFGQPPPYYSAANVTTGERNPLTGQPPQPKYLAGEYAEFTSEQDPRFGLVDWMSQPDNPFFAKAFVNRMWGHFFSRGLVNEVDDMRATNPPSNPEILDYLADEFVKSRFDMRHIIRLIATSQLYQLSSEPRPENEHDRQNFARFYARRMIAEVLHDAVDQTCATRTKFNNMSANARAIELPHEGFGSYFMDTFDRPLRVSVCECERSSGATLAQVLLMGNSDELENKIADGKGRIAVLTEKPEEANTDDVVVQLYLAAFSRFPAEEERTTACDYINAATEKRKAAEDLLWTLLNSREFAFNH